MPTDSREQRLAAKLRENLKRRKQQAKARSAAAEATEDESHSAVAGERAGAPLPETDDSDS